MARRKQPATPAVSDRNDDRKVEEPKMAEYDKGKGFGRMGCIVPAVAGGLVAAVLGIRGCTTVSAGHVGVQHTFGNVHSETIQPGITLRNPLSSVIEMTTRTREIKESMEVPTKDGLNTKLDVSVLYHLTSEKAPDVYKSLGDDEMYQGTFVEPMVRSTVRNIVANHRAADLYSGEGREGVASAVSAYLKPEFEARHLSMEQVLIRDLKLPEKLREAIDEKMAAEQGAQKMEYTIAKERKEAERKKIEAQGIADFQKIVTQGISPQLLEWKGIEATENLAKSPNSKIVVIGSGKNGLPIILNYDK